MGKFSENIYVHGIKPRPLDCQCDRTCKFSLRTMQVHKAWPAVTSCLHCLEVSDLLLAVTSFLHCLEVSD